MIFFEKLGKNNIKLLTTRNLYGIKNLSGQGLSRLSELFAALFF
tara:strand:- start:680 stop:811 length:132 start_codon:yes stop_codon:yes gene_type:complete